MAGLNHQFIRIGCALPRGRSFQIIPIRMKRATSIRKVTLIMATVRNASPAGRGVIACLGLRNVSVPNAGGERCKQRWPYRTLRGLPGEG